MSVKRTVLRWTASDGLGLKEHSGISLYGENRVGMPVFSSFIQSAVSPYLDTSVTRLSIESVDSDDNGLFGGITGDNLASYVGAAVS